MQTLTTKQAQALFKRGESEAVEFKKGFDRETVETLSAFANTRGGRVFVGVSDTGQVLGVDFGKETIQNWINPESATAESPTCSKKQGWWKSTEPASDVFCRNSNPIICPCPGSRKLPGGFV